ncbi:hypothetical protein BH23CHL8_BH23CHL8_27340 [soil metagenome]
MSRADPDPAAGVTVTRVHFGTERIGWLPLVPMLISLAACALPGGSVESTLLSGIEGP